VPTKIHKTFLIDLAVFAGNSGGPVYLVDRNRTYGGVSHPGLTQRLVGIVTRQAPNGLELAIVVPSVFIRETIDLLPDTPPFDTTPRK
jgi:hypothetical protein